MFNVSGIDVHKDFLEVAYRGRDGEIKVVEFDNNASGLTELVRFLRANNVSDVYFESTGDYYFALFYALKGAGFTPHVLNAYKVKRPEPNKTDEKDAIWLLKLGESRLFKGSYVPNESIQAIRFLSRKLVKMRDREADLKREIGSVLSRLGLNISGLGGKLRSKRRIKALLDLAAGKIGLKDVKDETVRTIYMAIKDKRNKPYFLVIQAYLREIRLLEREINRLNDALLAMVKPYKEQIEILTSVPGIGTNLAVKIFAEIGEIERFPSAKHLVSYAGLAPTAKNSGGKTRQGRPSMKSNKRLKRLMFLAALGAAKNSSPTVKTWFTQLSARGKHFKVIVTAIARKLLAIIWHLLTEGEKWAEENYSKKTVKIPGNKGIKLTVREAISLLEKIGYLVETDSTRPETDPEKHKKRKKTEK